MKWNYKEISRVITVDLVPVFQVDEMNLKLFNKVTLSLVNEKPMGWRSYMDALYKRDIILPEAFITQENKEKPVRVAVKLLNYADDHNYIIRPAQVMAVHDFMSKDILRQAYLHIKALNVVLGSSVKSYMVKKILLLPEFKHFEIAEKQQHLRDKQKTKIWQQLVFDVMQHYELKKHFQTKIDYALWKTSSVIPLKK